MNAAMKYMGLVGGIIVVGLVLSNPGAFNTVIGATAKAQVDLIRALQVR